MAVNSTRCNKCRLFCFYLARAHRLAQCELHSYCPTIAHHRAVWSSQKWRGLCFACRCLLWLEIRLGGTQPNMKNMTQPHQHKSQIASKSRTNQRCRNVLCVFITCLFCLPSLRRKWGRLIWSLVVVSVLQKMFEFTRTNRYGEVYTKKKSRAVLADGDDWRWVTLRLDQCSSSEDLVLLQHFCQLPTNRQVYAQILLCCTWKFADELNAIGNFDLSKSHTNSY